MSLISIHLELKQVSIYIYKKNKKNIVEMKVAIVIWIYHSINFKNEKLLTDLPLITDKIRTGMAAEQWIKHTGNRQATNVKHLILSII